MPGMMTLPEQFSIASKCNLGVLPLFTNSMIRLPWINTPFPASLVFAVNTASGDLSHKVGEVLACIDVVPLMRVV